MENVQDILVQEGVPQILEPLTGQNHPPGNEKDKAFISSFIIALLASTQSRDESQSSGQQKAEMKPTPEPIIKLVVDTIATFANTNTRKIPYLKESIGRKVQL